MDKKGRGRSEIAEFFYNETDYREGSGSEIIVSELDKLWKKGKYVVTIDELSAIVNKAYPALTKRLKSIEGRVKKVIDWGRSKGFIDRDADAYVIKPKLK